MKLPNGDQAVVEPRKLKNYCLNPEHDDGKHKARVFDELLGLGDADYLIEMLKAQAVAGEATPGELDRFGQRHEIDFELSGPKGKAMARSVRIIRTGEASPRLVTFYIPK